MVAGPLPRSGAEGAEGADEAEHRDELHAEELRDALDYLLARHPQRFVLPAFEDPKLEAAYHRWHRAIYKRELRIGLLLANFLYFLCTIAFSSWSHLQQFGGAVNETAPSASEQTLQLALEAAVVAILSLSFAFTFTSCASRMPQTFAALILLLATTFVTLRSALLNIDGAGVYSSPVRIAQRRYPLVPSVMLILIVCFYLGNALLRMPFLATLLVGLALNISYGIAALADISQAPEGAAWYPMALVFATVACAVSSHSLERAQRQLFLSQISMPRVGEMGKLHVDATCSAADTVAEGCALPSDHMADARQSTDCAFRPTDHGSSLKYPAPSVCFVSPVNAGECVTCAYTPPTCSPGGVIVGTSGNVGAGPSSLVDIAEPANSSASQPMPMLPLSPMASSPTRQMGRPRSHSVSSLDTLRLSLPGSGLNAYSPQAVGAQALTGARGVVSADNLARPGGTSWPAGRQSMEALGHAVRASLQELPGAVVNLLQLRGVTSGANSVEAVQTALAETGIASLHEFLARSIAKSLHELPSHLALGRTTKRRGAGDNRGVGNGAMSAPGVGSSSTLQRDASEALLVEAQSCRQVYELVDITKLPRWHTPYPFVRTGYRTQFSTHLAWRSVFRLHNETLNIWTELIPAAAFTAWTVEALNKHSDAPRMDRLVMGAGLVCANIVRPLCSGLAHLLHCTSAGSYIAWWSVDYISISIAILTTAFVYGHFAFYCSAQLQLLFLVSTVGLLSTSLMSVLAVASPTVRNAAFLLFVIFCHGVPFIYELTLKFGGGRVHESVPAAYLYYWVGSLGMFVFALLVKESNMPERAVQQPWNDVFFASHQIWHVLVNAAFVLGTFCAWDVYLNWRPACIVAPEYYD